MSYKQIAQLEKEGSLTLEWAERSFDILRGDVEIMHEDIEGWLVASDESHGIMVALDTEMSEMLQMMGLSRELVSRIQAMRRDSGLDITDRIRLRIEGTEKLLEAVQRNDAYIRDETLATALELAPLDSEANPTAGTETVNGEICRIGLDKS
jgi:isoleucyl-tRNA synthetase